MSDTIACPFVYANGRKCAGHVQRAMAYGPRGEGGTVERDRVKKYRLWCSEKWDHAGATSGFIAKDRMEFYPDRLPPGFTDALWDKGVVESC
jgi:hypothetical protein